MGAEIFTDFSYEGNETGSAGGEDVFNILGNEYVAEIKKAIL